MNLSFSGCVYMLQIPEEEKNLGPLDRLIHVYHFTKDTTQNQMVKFYLIYLYAFFIFLSFDTQCWHW